MKSIGIHIFRKDLRIEDNLALNELLKLVDHVVGVFIFDAKQIKRTSSNKSHHSAKAAQFIIDSVNDLDKQCGGKLLTTYGNPAVVVESLLKSIKPSVVSFNSDYTPYSISRDESIASVCRRLKVQLIMNHDDQTLAPMESLLKSNGTPYMVFGTFYKHLMKQPIHQSIKKKIVWVKPNFSFESFDWKPIESSITGGRTQALQHLKGKFTNDDLLMTQTSRIGAYLNQGCVSVREVYHSNKSLGRSLAWRDFFLCIYRFTPTGNSYNKFIDERYDQIKWPNVKEVEWKRFMNCDTGYLMVDAIMAELLETGFINNRARLILATFWIKYLMISPLDSEYGSQVGFSRLLIDCSASQNKLNHQWIISDLDLSGRRFKMKGLHALTGRMIRVDNDMIRKFDPEYTYISKWLPAFKDKSLKECKLQMKATKPMYEWRERYNQYGKLFDRL